MLWLAAAAGMPVQEVPLTPAMDASELLGCFEQVDTQGRLLGFARAARAAADAATRLAVLDAAPAPPPPSPSGSLAECLQRCTALEALLAGDAQATAAVGAAGDNAVLVDGVSELARLHVGVCAEPPGSSN